LIPVGFVETDFVPTQVIEIDSTDIIPGDPILMDCETPDNDGRVYRVAFMLPLYLDEVDSLMHMSKTMLMENKNAKPFKFIEFYEGALIAIEELKELGVNMQIDIYDVPRDLDNTVELLKNPQLEKTDLIISLVYSKNFEIISNFSKQHQIPLVNAISKRRKIIYDNPYVFKVEPNEEELYREAAQYILEEYSSWNIIIVRSNPYQLAKEFSDIKTRLESALPSSFEVDSVVYQNDLHVISYSVDSLAGILRESSLERKNLVVALGLNEVFAIELFTKLNFVRDSIDYQVIGLPDWSSYDGLDVAYSQPLSLHTATRKYVDYGQDYVKRFVLKYRELYGIEPQMNRYAFLGYDVTKYFLTALSNYGIDFAKCLKYLDVDLLENQLYFKKYQGTGYENTNWNIIKQKDFRYQLVK